MLCMLLIMYVKCCLNLLLLLGLIYFYPLSLLLGGVIEYFFYTSKILIGHGRFFFSIFFNKGRKPAIIKLNLTFLFRLTAFYFTQNKTVQIDCLIVQL